MLHAEPTTVNLAFPPLKQYAIPSYQRNYVWTREGQWEPLWDDLRALTQQMLDDGKAPAAKPHFLGTIITKQIPTEGFINCWWVIDGQQRLTTIQILTTFVEDRARGSIRVVVANGNGEEDHTYEEPPLYVRQRSLLGSDRQRAAFFGQARRPVSVLLCPN